MKNTLSEEEIEAKRWKKTMMIQGHPGWNDRLLWEDGDDGGGDDDEDRSKVVE